MTTSKEDVLTEARISAMLGMNRAPKNKDVEPLVEWTFCSYMRARLIEQVSKSTGIVFPSNRWRFDPVGFARDVLGVDPWSRQIEIIEAVRDHKRVAVKSGHKVSKSHTSAIIALWFFCSFEEARVVMTSTTARQVDDIFWREVRIVKSKSGICVECKKHNASCGASDKIEAPCEHSAIIDGEIAEKARSGLNTKNFREIKGFTAREAEAVAGISAPNLLYILDEASGIRSEIFEAIEGNRAGGARLVMFSNPTRTEGEFYEAFHAKARFYSTHSISSEETPNVLYGDDDPRAIPGLATREWVEEKKDEWGVDSPLYRVRVKGEFCSLEEGKIFSAALIIESEERWKETRARLLAETGSEEAPLVDIEIEGRLRIGFDPAGEGVTADESVWCIRRGKRVIAFSVLRSISKATRIKHTIDLCKQYGAPSEIPIVTIDSEGKIGAETHGAMEAYLAKENPEFELIAIRASDKAHRDPQLYDRQRDNLTGALLDWMRDGGEIPTDAKLEGELQIVAWEEQEKTGKVKVTSKKDMKRELGRSPDRYDALALATWETLDSDHGRSARTNTLPSMREREREETGVSIDPYGGLDAFTY